MNSGAVGRGRLLAGLTLAGLTLVLGGCGNQPEGAPALTSAPPGPTSLAPSPVLSETPGPTPSASPSSDEEPTEGPTDDTTEPDPDESDKPPVLDKGVSGRSLTTADFFETPDEWADGRFNVAGQQDLAGIGGPLSSCQDDPNQNSPTIELRLANNFTRLSMKVGQSDESPSSESEVGVKVLGNGKYLDTVRVPFNKIANLQAPVTGVNALKIQVWMTGENCDGTDVEAVLMDLKVE